MESLESINEGAYKLLSWWGYLHTSGTIQVKRYFRNEDIEEAMESPFVAYIVLPFEAISRENAEAYIKENLKSRGLYPAKQETDDSKKSI